MDETSEPPSPSELTHLLRDELYGEVRDILREYRHLEPERRRSLIRTLSSLAEDSPSSLQAIVSPLAKFLDDEERSVRLSTAKLFVVLAREKPDSFVGVVDELSDTLADEDEFYYVRARSAEALGYVAVEYPTEVATPEMIANLTTGLSFDEPEVKVKLAKALAYVALGNPSRLRHRTEDLAEYLADDDRLVRYHISTAFVAVASEHPDDIAGCLDELVTLLDDECEYVRGRAAEALGLVSRAEEGDISIPEDRLSSLKKRDGCSDAAFTADRARFALRGISDDKSDSIEDAIGSVEEVREHTDDIVEEITSPDDEICPNCGLELPDNSLTVCPRCGVPH